MGNTAQQCRPGLFQDSDFAGDLEDSKSTSGGLLCIFGSHTFVPVSWMSKKQTSVSHSSTEAEIISLDAGSHMNGIPALTLWDLVIEVCHSVPNRTDLPKREPQGRKKSWNSVGLLCLDTGKLISEQKEITGVSRYYVDADKLVV